MYASIRQGKAKPGMARKILLDPAAYRAEADLVFVISSPLNVK